MQRKVEVLWILSWKCCWFHQMYWLIEVHLTNLELRRCWWF
jgi:hypothetical protein